MKIIKLILLLFLSTSYSSIAQISGCATDQSHAARLADNASYVQQMTEAQNILNGQAGTPELVINGIYYIPTVVHVIHLGQAIGTPENPTDSQIAACLDRINLGLAANHPAFANTSSGGQNIPIQLELAKRAPNCLPSTGVERIDLSNITAYVNYGVQFQSSTPGLNFQFVANQSFYDPKQYFNIYIVNKIQNGAFSGWGFYPTLSSFVGDGVYVTYPNVNAANPKLWVHEVGHYFGLRHTFEGAMGSNCPVNSNCSTDGDFICDTEPHLQSIPCSPTTTNACTFMPLGDVVYNLMSYTNCVDRFTPMQEQRMMNSLLNIRSGLVTSWGAVPFPTLNITSNNPICTGDSIHFLANNTGLDMNPVFQWKVNGLVVGGSASTYSYLPTIGDSVQCIMQTADTCVTGGVVNSNVVYVQQIMPMTASMFNLTPSSMYCEGDTVQLIAPIGNLGTNVISTHEWYVNNVLVSSNDTLTLILLTSNVIEYAVTFQSTIACDTTNKKTFFTDSISATPRPAKPIITINMGQLQSNYMNGQVQWYEGGTGLIAGATNQNYTPSTGGNYYCIATINGCSSEPSATVLFYPLATNDFTKNTIVVYPNPSENGIFQISTIMKGKRYAIFSSHGRVLDQGILDRILDLNNYSKGVYFLEVYYNEENVIRRKLTW